MNVKLTVLATLALVGLAAALYRPALAEGDGEAVTVKGEIVDLACYLPRGEKGRGPAHEECAQMCAQGGAPLGVLDDAGHVLLLLEDHEKPAPYKDAKKLAGGHAEITGKKVDRGGLPGLVVSSAKKS